MFTITIQMPKTIAANRSMSVSVHSMMRSRDGMDKYQKEAIPTRGKPENIPPKCGGGEPHTKVGGALRN